MTGDQYDEPYDRRAAAGFDVHGEATFVEATGVRSVLDAGCGTGRIGRELVKRGLDVVGVDLDPALLSTAQRKAPEIEWHLADLEEIRLGRTFEGVLMAGNVMVFLSRGQEQAVVDNMVRHLEPGGPLIAGFELRPGGLTLEQYDQLTRNAGLELVERYATWERDPWEAGGSYAVSVHRAGG